jgi:hypothetical protein
MIAGTCRTHGEMRNKYNIWIRRSQGKTKLGDLGVDRRIILK